MKIKDALIIGCEDNVATVLQDVQAGDVVKARLEAMTLTVNAREVIPFGFKIALTNIPQGRSIIKYGEVIGTATRDIEEGALIHIHNLEGTRGRGDLERR